MNQSVCDQQPNATLAMPLTQKEREFLDVYVYEATNGPPFGGPATRDLNQRGISYPDLSWILTAYQRELSAEGKIPSGIKNLCPPVSPWKNLREAEVRNEVLRKELEFGSAAYSEPSQQVAEQHLKSLFDLEEAERVLQTEGHMGKSLEEIWKELKAKYPEE